MKLKCFDWVGNPHVQPFAHGFETLLIPVTLVSEVVDVVHHIWCFDFYVLQPLVFIFVKPHHVLFWLVKAYFKFFDCGVTFDVNE